MTTNAKGFDFSHWQHDVDPKEAGKQFDFVGLKATEGTTYVDPEFKSRRSALLAQLRAPDHPLAALLHYHFLNTSSSGSAQADHLVDTVGKVEAGEHLVLDFEVGGSIPRGAEFVRRVKARTGKRPILYTALGYVGSTHDPDLTACDLWLADWDEPYTVPAGWKAWTFLQYTAFGGALGVRPLDLDEFNGNRSALLRYSGLSGAGPDPQPKPKGGFMGLSFKDEDEFGAAMRRQLTATDKDKNGLGQGQIRNALDFMRGAYDVYNTDGSNDAEAAGKRFAEDLKKAAGA